MILLRGVDDDNFCSTAITQFEGMGASMLFKLCQGQRRSINADLKSWIMNESRREHRDDLFDVGQLTGD